MPRTKVTPEIEERIIQLYRAKGTYKSIGRQLDLDWRTVKGVVNQVAKLREEDHWREVTRRVDAELLRQHYSVLMLLAQELRASASVDPIERVHEESQVVLGHAQSRAVHRALEHNMLPGIPTVTGGGGTAGNIRLTEHGCLLFQSLTEHEPRLKTLLAKWAKGWNSVIRERGGLTAELEKSLLADDTKAYLERHGVTPSQAADIFNAALTEALEHKLKRLKLMNFECTTEGAGQVIRRVRKDPNKSREIYFGANPDTAQRFYEKTLKLALQQPEVWDRLDNAYRDVNRCTEEINRLVATLALRGRPSGKCTFCPSAGS